MVPPDPKLNRIYSVTLETKAAQDLVFLARQACMNGSEWLSEELPEILREKRIGFLETCEQLYLDGELSKEEFEHMTKNRVTLELWNCRNKRQEALEAQNGRIMDAKVRSMTFDDKRVQAILNAGCKAEIINLNDADIKAMRKISNDLALYPRKKIRAKGLIINILIPCYCFKKEVSLDNIHNLTENFLKNHVKKKGLSAFSLGYGHLPYIDYQAIYLY